MTDRHLFAVPPDEELTELERLLLRSLNEVERANQNLDAIERWIKERK